MLDPTDTASGPTGDDFLSLEEVAALLKISVATLHRLRHAAGFPDALRIGRAVRFSRAEIESWAHARGGDGILLPTPTT